MTYHGEYRPAPERSGGSNAPSGPSRDGGGQSEECWCIVCDSPTEVLYRSVTESLGSWVPLCEVCRELVRRRDPETVVARLADVELSRSPMRFAASLCDDVDTTVTLSCADFG